MSFRTSRRAKADWKSFLSKLRDCPSEHLEEQGSPDQPALLNQLNTDFTFNKVKSHILRQPFDDATGNLKEAKLATIF